MRLVDSSPHPLFIILFIFRIVALKPDHPRVTFKGHDMGGDPVQEPAIMADDDGAPPEAQQGLLQGAQVSTSRSLVGSSSSKKLAPESISSAICKRLRSPPERLATGPRACW